MQHLCALLNIYEPSAYGHLQLLWWWAETACPRGDVGRYSDQEIATAAQWIRRADLFVQALTEAEWLHPDTRHRLILHDWPEHAPRHVRAMLKRQKTSFLSCYGRPEIVPLPKKKQKTLIDGIDEPLPKKAKKKTSVVAPPAEPSAIDNDLLRIMVWWNSLSTDRLVAQGVNVKSPSTAVRKSWIKAKREGLTKLFVESELPKIRQMIQRSTFVQNAGWFRLERLISGKNKDHEYLIVKLMDAGYVDRTQDDPRGNIAVLDSFDEMFDGVSDE